MSCKLFLVPEDVIQTWKSNQRADQIDKPIQTSLNQMDKSMQAILKDNKLDDYNKEKLYTQKLITFMDRREDQKPLPAVPLDSVPKVYKTKANALLNYLRSDKDIAWDERGQLLLKGQVVPTSNIVDLIHDGLRLRKKMARPPGWQELSQHLMEKNVPKELIGNEEWGNEPSPSKKEKEDFVPYYTPYDVKSKRRVRVSKEKGVNLIHNWIKAKDKGKKKFVY